MDYAVYLFTITIAIVVVYSAQSGYTLLVI